MEIIYYAANTTMGDTPDADCEKFRDWALEQLEKEYPNHEISISSDEGMNNYWTDDYSNEDEIADFCSRLWDRCPWDWA
jgi:hypothetical protein